MALDDSVVDEPQPELNLLVFTFGNLFCKNLCLFLVFFSQAKIFQKNEIKIFKNSKIKESDFEGFQLPEVSVKKCKKLYWDKKL
jgi:hypothetical protein